MSIGIYKYPPQCGFQKGHKGYVKSGWRHTDEAKKKISIALKGKKRSPHTEETKRKISDAHKGL